jgi:hypothetical protein
MARRLGAGSWRTAVLRAKASCCASAVAAYEVVGGVLGVASGLPFPVGEDLFGSLRGSQRGLDIQAGRARPGGGRIHVLLHRLRLLRRLRAWLSPISLLGRVKRRQFGVRVPAAKLGVGQQRPLAVRLGCGVPFPPDFGHLGQSLAVGADLLAQGAVFLGLPQRFCSVSSAAASARCHARTASAR